MKERFPAAHCQEAEEISDQKICLIKFILGGHLWKLFRHQLRPLLPLCSPAILLQLIWTLGLCTPASPTFSQTALPGHLSSVQRSQ